MQEMTNTLFCSMSRDKCSLSGKETDVFNAPPVTNSVIFYKAVIVLKL